jgi:hypothetical protein
MTAKARVIGSDLKGCAAMASSIERSSRDKHSGERRRNTLRPYFPLRQTMIADERLEEASSGNVMRSPSIESEPASL